MSAIRTRLHVPQAPARPGEKPDFSYLKLSAAGAVERPDPNAPLAQTEHLANELVRVLGDDHRAVGPWDPHLAPTDLQLGLRHMMLTRIYDDRMHRAQRQGKISFYIKSTGEEAVSVAQHGAAPADMLFPAYRKQGLQIARGRQPRRPDVPVSVELARHVQGTADARHVSLDRTDLSRSPAT